MLVENGLERPDGYALAIGAQLIVEGIETAGELDVLRSLGVHLGQGFHLARPAALAELEAA